MAVDYTTQTTGGIGDAVLRKEDRKFVTGEGRYVDDLKLPAMLHAVFVRSPFGHARITAIDSRTAVPADITSSTISTRPLIGAPTSVPPSPWSLASLRL